MASRKQVKAAVKGKKASQKAAKERKKKAAKVAEKPKVSARAKYREMKAQSFRPISGRTGKLFKLHADGSQYFASNAKKMKAIIDKRKAEGKMTARAHAKASDRIKAGYMHINSSRG